MKLSIRTQLLAAFGVLLVFTAAVGWIGISQAGVIRDHARQMYDDDLVGTGQIAILVENALLNQNKVLEHVLTAEAAQKGVIETALVALDREVEAAVKTVRESDVAKDQQEELGEFTRAWTSYKETRDRSILPASRAGKTQEALGYVTGEAGQRFNSVHSALDALIASKAATARAINLENEAIFARSRWLIIGITCAAVLFGLVIAFVLSRSLLQTIHEFVTLASKIAQGDLAHRLAVNRKDELGELGGNLNQMADGLSELAAQVRQGSQGITAAATEILATVSQHTASANEQSAAVNQTTATVDELRASSEQTARQAGAVAQLAQTSAQVGQDGAQSVEAILRAMTDIRAKVEGIAQDILALSEHTQQIGEIILTVNDIADQSNILALNAAIEAAKAGEQGKGFAVVAAEVRNLAEQSKQATAKVRTILGDIQKATNAAVLATEQGTRGVETGAGLAQRAGEVITRLAGDIRDAAQASQQIAAAAHQQSAAMDQIAQAMREINQATVQFVAGARQSQTAAEGLTNLSRQLQALTEKYKLAA